MTQPSCGILPEQFVNEFRLDVTDFGISCAIVPSIDPLNRSQSVVLPEIKADPFEVHYQSDIMYEPTDKIRLGKIIIDIVMELGSYNYQNFYNWMKVAKIDREKGYATAVLSLMNPATSQVVVRYEYYDTLCINISPVNFDITDNSVARFTVTLQPSSFEIKR